MTSTTAPTRLDRRSTSRRRFSGRACSSCAYRGYASATDEHEDERARRRHRLAARERNGWRGVPDGPLITARLRALSPSRRADGPERERLLAVQGCELHRHQGIFSLASWPFSLKMRRKWAPIVDAGTSGGGQRRRAHPSPPPRRGRAGSGGGPPRRPAAPRQRRRPRSPHLWAAGAEPSRSPCRRARRWEAQRGRVVRKQPPRPTVGAFTLLRRRRSGRSGRGGGCGGLVRRHAGARLPRSGRASCLRKRRAA